MLYPSLLFLHKSDRPMLDRCAIFVVYAPYGNHVGRAIRSLGLGRKQGAKIKDTLGWKACF